MARNRPESPLPDVSDLRVELLYSPDCPHWERTRAALHRILSRDAIETPIELVVVNGLDDAAFLGFVGSPTVRLNGVDVAPPPPGTEPSVGCRSYRQADGSLAGTVPEELLREAIRARQRGRLEAFQRAESAKVALVALAAAAEEAAEEVAQDTAAAETAEVAAEEAAAEDAAAEAAVDDAAADDAAAAYAAPDQPVDQESGSRRSGWRGATSGDRESSVDARSAAERRSPGTGGTT